MLKKPISIVLVAPLLCAYWQASSARAMTARDTSTVTRIDGQAFLLGHRSKTPNGPPPHYLHKGHYYSYKKIRLGDNFPKGNLLKTSHDGRVRLIYNYGDLIEVSPDSFIVAESRGEGLKALPSIRVKRGRIRVSIKHKGVLSGMVFASPMADFQIKGTEFYLAVGEEDKTFLGVLRGKVVVFVKGKKKPVIVSAPNAVTVDQEAEISKIRTLTRGQVLAIQGHTHVSQKALETPPLFQQKRLKALEAEAYDSMMEDIRLQEPTIYRWFTSDDNTWRSLDSLLGYTIKKLSYRVPLVRGKPDNDGPSDPPALNTMFKEED